MSKELETTRVPGFMLQDLRAQLQVEVRQQEQRDDRRLREVGLEDVGLDELRQLLTPSFSALCRDRSTMSGLYSTPQRLHAALGGGDHGAAVAGAEIDQDVGRRHLRHVEHAVDQRLRGRNPDHVLAGLADGRLDTAWRAFWA